MMSGAVRRLGGRATFVTLAALAGALAVLPAGAQASNPTIGLRPGSANEQFIAVADEVAHDGVDLALPWDKVEPVRNQFSWQDTTEELDAFLARGVDIHSFRVTGAPDWAVAGNECEFTMCPPEPQHYDEYRRFVFRAVNRYGPSSDYQVERFAFWNEPDLDSKWGGETFEQESYKDYSAILARFRAAAEEADPAAKVDAGEVLAGSDTIRPWSKQFTRYNTREGRNGNYDTYTIHGYSRTPEQVAEKLNDYQALPGVTRVSVSEFGWSVGDPTTQSGAFKCAETDAEQESMFRRAVEAVRESARGVGRLSWLNAIDRDRDKRVRCLDNTGHYTKAAKPDMNPYGLYKAKPDGSLWDLVGPFGEPDPQYARPIADTFSDLSGQP
jgi:hypothetical protein